MHCTFTRISSLVISLFVIAIASATTYAAPLSGSGTHLPIPTPNPGDPVAQARSISNIIPQTGWTGSWSSPVLTPWLGSFTVDGPVPSGNTNPTNHPSPTGLSYYDFSSMPNGVLPAGTYFRFGDVDAGSSNAEVYTLTAFNSSGVITTPWLDEPVGVSGTFSASSTPQWSFAAATGTYTIDGSSVSGNPNTAFYLPNNTDITSMEVTRTTDFQNFALYAPVPEPATASLAGLLGMFCLSRFSTRKQ